MVVDTKEDHLENSEDHIFHNKMHVVKHIGKRWEDEVKDVSKYRKIDK